MSDLRNDLKTFNLIVEALLDDEQENPVSEKIDAKDLYSRLDLSLSDNPISEEEFQKALKDIVLSTPKTATKLFFNQLFGGRQGKAILGDLLAVMLNNSMYTYKVAGPQVGVEKEVINRVCDLIGFGEESGGTFPAGGSMSNYMGMIMARDAKDPLVKNEGVDKPMIAYTSAHSHYSNAKNASFAGIGRNNLRYIPVNDKGEMRVDKLEAQILKDLADDNVPFYINATAGTTVLGAFDQFDEISAVASKYQIWLHIDGAYCGGVIFSEKNKHLIKGVEKADSFSFNAHKMLGTPLTCSIIVVQNNAHLYNSFGNEAEYLYQTDQDDFNLGKTSFQCGRRNDALKFWALWKSVGTKGLSNIVDEQFVLASVARNYVKAHPDYELYSFEDSVSICFNYKNIPANELCTALYEDGQTMVGYGAFNEIEFVRLVTINTNNSPEDILHFFKVIEEYVAKNKIKAKKEKV
jgi:glutamate/tyrosine decarboxylase-like PLP-dependent enzyme